MNFFCCCLAIAHSEGGEFHCSETNPRALLLISVVFSPQHISIGTWNRSEQSYDLFPLLAFFPTPVLIKGGWEICG